MVHTLRFAWFRYNCTGASNAFSNVLRRTVQVTITATFYHPHAPVDLRRRACSGEPDRSTGACVAAFRYSSLYTSFWRRAGALTTKPKVIEMALTLRVVNGRTERMVSLWLGTIWSVTENTEHFYRRQNWNPVRYVVRLCGAQADHDGQWVCCDSWLCRNSISGGGGVICHQLFVSSKPEYLGTVMSGLPTVPAPDDRWI
jgi:hypothetical protein